MYCNMWVTCSEYAYSFTCLSRLHRYCRQADTSPSFSPPVRNLSQSLLDAVWPLFPSGSATLPEEMGDFCPVSSTEQPGCAAPFRIKPLVYQAWKYSFKKLPAHNPSPPCRQGHLVYTIWRVQSPSAVRQDQPPWLPEISDTSSLAGGCHPQFCKGFIRPWWRWNAAARDALWKKKKTTYGKQNRIL